MMKKIRAFRNDDKGATAVEYGLIVALISIAAVGGMTTLGGKVKATFNNAATTISQTVPS